MLLSLLVLFLLSLVESLKERLFVFVSLAVRVLLPFPGHICV